MKPRILIEIKGGCLANITTNGDFDVFLLDHDNHDTVGQSVPVDLVVDNHAFTALVDPIWAQSEI